MKVINRKVTISKKQKVVMILKSLKKKNFNKI